MLKLTCSNCNRKLKITDDIERFCCNNCGKEWSVIRGGGIVTLKSIENSDEVKKYSKKDSNYISEIKKCLLKQLDKPDEDFIRYILKKLNMYNGNLTSNVIMKFEPLIEKSISMVIDELKNNNWYTIEELIAKDNKLYSIRPVKVKLPDGNTISVKTWAGVVKEIVSWLYDNKKFKKSHYPIPDYAGKKRYCISKSPVHPTKKSFKNLINIDNKIYLETNYSSINNLRNLIQILTTIEQETDIFKIFIEEKYQNKDTVNKENEDSWDDDEQEDDEDSWDDDEQEDDEDSWDDDEQEDDEDSWDNDEQEDDEKG